MYAAQIDAIKEEFAGDEFPVMLILLGMDSTYLTVQGIFKVRPVLQYLSHYLCTALTSTPCSWLERIDFKEELGRILLRSAASLFPLFSISGFLPDKAQTHFDLVSHLRTPCVCM
jgi:hypothetical protein